MEFDRLRWWHERIGGRASSKGRSRNHAPRPVERLEARELLAVSVCADQREPEGFPFTGAVATFAAADVQGSPSSAARSRGATATSAPGTITTATTGFSVTGANTYAVPGTYPVTVTVYGHRN